MSAQVTILQLPAAGAITGTESVPIVQNGVTVQTTTGAIAASPSQPYTYLTVNQTPQLANSRYFGATNGLSITDGGAQGLFNITTTGALSSLVGSGTGLQVKTSPTDIVGRSMVVSGNGLSITNGDGVAGNPTVSLAGQVLNFANASFDGLVSLSISGTVTSATITGTANQVSVANGTGVGGNPTISLADNPVLPGVASTTLPIGTSLDRPASPVNGMIRYNSTFEVVEGYLNGSWQSIAAGVGVTSIATGTGLAGGPITSTGTISISDTAVTAGSYGSATQVGTFTVNAQGQLTSASNTTIANIPNSSLINSSVTVGTTAIPLGSSSLTLGGLTTVTVTQDPVAALDLATKQYVDAIAQGLDPKASCVAGTTVDITLSGTQTVDGVALVAGNRCLVKNQTAQATNGIYVVSAGAWTRALDMDVWAEVPGAFVFIEQGSTLADTGWVCTSNAGGTLGTTAITWVQFAAAGAYTAGTGLTLSGTQFSITNTSVSAAAYGSASSVPTFTVNAQGQLTLAANSAIAINGNQITSGLVAIANGGTNSSATATAGGAGYGTGTAHAYTAAGTAGQVLTSAGASAPTWSGISGGTF